MMTGHTEGRDALAAAEVVVPSMWLTLLAGVLVKGAGVGSNA